MTLRTPRLRFDARSRTWLPLDQTLSRRRFLGTAAGVGAAALTAPAFLRRVSAQSEGMDAYTSASIDWRQADGASLDLGGVDGHPWANAISPLLPQFTELTGISVDFQAASEAEYGAQLPISVGTGSANPDVFMVPAYGPAVSGGWLEPLDGYWDDAALTDLDWYDQDDVFAGARDFPIWPEDGVRYAVAITAESQTLFLRQDLFEEAGLSAPETMDDLYEAAVALNTDGVAGIAMRARPTAGSVAWAAAGFVFSYGGELINADGEAVFDSEEAIAAIDMYGGLLRDAGPQGVGGYDWYESLEDFTQGRAAIAGDSSNFTLQIEDPDQSDVAGNVLYGAIPSGDGAPPKPNMWHWLLGINANSENKTAAWLFLQWVTSRPTGIMLAQNRAAVTRTSAWEDPQFRAEVFGEQAAEAALANLQAADATVMTRAWFNPQWNQVGDLFAIAANEVITGARGAEDALLDAAEQANRVLGR